MARVKLKLTDNIARVVFIETDATIGATLGTNLFLPDGSVATPTTFAAWLGTAGSSSGTMAHRLLSGLALGNDHPQYTRRDTLTTRGDMYVRDATNVVRFPLGTSSQVLRSNGTDPAWQTISPVLTLSTDITGSATFTNLGDAVLATTITANAVTNAKFRQSAATSLVGRSANSAGDVADIAASADGQVLRRTGGTLSFGDVPMVASSFANPTASIGLTAVNGSALTAMRSDAAPALSQGIAPTWTAQHIFGFSGQTASGEGAVAIKSVSPIQSWNASSAAADTKIWLNYANTAGHWFGAALNDANTIVRAWVDVLRTGVAITSISFGNTTDNPAVNFLGSGAVTFSGSPVFSAGLSTPRGTFTQSSTGVNGDAAVAAVAAIPAMSWRATGQAADNRVWTNYANGTSWFGATLNDANSVARTWVQVTRVNVAVSAIALGNATDNPTFSLVGTGSATFGGPLLLPDGSVGALSVRYTNDPDTGRYRSGTNSVRDVAGGVASTGFDDNSTAGNTRFLIYDVDNATLERVSVGAADSGGTGFKLLRIPN